MERVWNGNAVMRYLLRSATVIALAFCLSRLAVAAPTITGTTITIDGSTSFDELPAGLERRMPIGLAPTEMAAILRGQPDLVVRGRLIVTAAGPGLPRVLTVNTLEISEHGEIISGGNDLQIIANKIRTSGGRIIAFSAGDNPQPAPEGRRGGRGGDAGTVVLSGELDANGLLRVSLNGQHGQAGGRGVKGPPGAPGARGDNAADHLFDCAHGGGNGGQGSPGGRGGNGGAGGSGGNGGLLVLRGSLVSQRQQIDFVAHPGKAADGGEGGLGGDGGPGGSGGSGSTYCGGGHGGPSGPQGISGPNGPAGSDGVSGRVVAD